MVNMGKLVSSILKPLFLDEFPEKIGEQITSPTNTQN
jgi:hypothetical protein